MSRRVVVIQPLPGVGDMIWHLPHIRAIAAHVGTPVTLVARPRSSAAEIFAAEDTVGDIIWLDRTSGQRGMHNGPRGLVRFVWALRDYRFDVCYLLHQSETLAFATWAAGIPDRHGYSAGALRLWLNQRPFLSGPQRRLNRFEQAEAWLKAARIRVTEAEPRLRLPATARQIARRRLGAATGPIVTLGIGSSEDYKQWGAERFTELIRKLARQGWSRFILMGGPPQTALAEEIRRRIELDTIELMVMVDFALIEAAALLAESAFYVGNDTGFLNMAAALGIRSYGLFGATDPFFHLRQVVPITPPDGKPSRSRGMARITPDAVLAVISADRSRLAA